jgi:hypothetical protein
MLEERNEKKKKQGGKALKRSPPITTYRKNSHPLTIASSICTQLSKQQHQNKNNFSTCHDPSSEHHFLQKIINKRGRLHAICCR